MTRQHLRTFCVLLLSAFVLFYGAVTSQRASSEIENNEDKLRELEDKLETLESEIEELKDKNERLELELIYRRR